jgi:hypothetical protein
MTNTQLNFDSFSHGQILSKLWLCEKLEPYIPTDAVIMNLASWHNVLGLMLMLRNPSKYKMIYGMDIDASAIEIANKICDTWVIEKRIQNICSDVNKGFRYFPDVVINCSPEHIVGNEWFNKISKGTLVCIQTSNVTDPTAPWLIKTPCPTMDQFQSMYSLSKVHFCGEQRIQYATWGYDRYMIIGVK